MTFISSPGPLNLSLSLSLYLSLSLSHTHTPARTHIHRCLSPSKNTKAPENIHCSATYTFLPKGGIHAECSFFPPSNLPPLPRAGNYQSNLFCLFFIMLFYFFVFLRFTSTPFFRLISIFYKFDIFFIDTLSFEVVSNFEKKFFSSRINALIFNFHISDLYSNLPSCLFSGLRFSVPPRFDTVEWAGLGPHEAYTDRY